MAAYEQYTDLYSDFDDRILSDDVLELTHDVSGHYDIREFKSPFDLSESWAVELADAKSESDGESITAVETDAKRPAGSKSSDYVEQDICVPAGRCDHKHSRIDCWKCNPCTICPDIKWKGLTRPSPRNKHHLRTTIHREKMMAINATRDGSNGASSIPCKRPKQRKKCGHEVRLVRCRECNPCAICYNPIINIAPANTLAHRRSHSHVANVVASVGFW